MVKTQNLKSYYKFIIALICFISLAFIFTGCDNNKNKSHFESVSIHNSLVRTQTVYYRGDEFNPSKTFVDLKCVDVENQKKWWYNAYAINELPNIQYEVIGFDSSEVTESQSVTIKFTSNKYKGELKTTFTISIEPEYIKEVSIVDTENQIKSEYMLNETIDYSKLSIKYIYSNNREEFETITEDMVEGFDTQTISAKSRTLTINTQSDPVKFNYTVVPGMGYEVFSEQYLTCFVPTEDLGFNQSGDANENVWIKTGVGGLSIGCYQSMGDITEQRFKINFETSDNILKPNLIILSFGKKEINGREVTVCDYKYKNQTGLYRAALYTRTVTFTNGLSSVTGERTIGLLFANYSSSTWDSEFRTISNNIINSIY